MCGVPADGGCLRVGDRCVPQCAGGWWRTPVHVVRLCLWPGPRWAPLCFWCCRVCADLTVPPSPLSACACAAPIANHLTVIVPKGSEVLIKLTGYDQDGDKVGARGGRCCVAPTALVVFKGAPQTLTLARAHCTRSSLPKLSQHQPAARCSNYHKYSATTDTSPSRAMASCR